MQHYTIKLSYQPGRKLGLVLVNSPIGPDAYYSEAESEFDSEDEGLLSIRGGGFSTALHRMDGQEPGSDGDDQARSNNNIGMASGRFPRLPPKTPNTQFATAEVVSVARVVRAAYVPLPQAARIVQTTKATSGYGSETLYPRMKKRKRPTSPCISEDSIIFKFAQKIHAAPLTPPKQPTKDENQNLGLPQHSFDPSNIDALIEWGRENIPPITFFGGQNIKFENMNTESLNFALTSTIMPGDIMEKIQYTRMDPPKRGKSKSSDARRRRCQPYFRSDHYTTYYCENKSSQDVANVLRPPQNFPLYITFKRIPVFDGSGAAATRSNMTDHFNSPPRKRIKKSESTIGFNGKGDEVICLLDSSDEESVVDVGTKDDSRNNGCDYGHNKSNNASSSQVPIEIDSPTSSSRSTPQHPRLAPPDPRKISLLDDDDFVLTPFGPGKIISSRVERNACSNPGSDASIFNPTIIYSIDLHFGICHVPASQVKSISGTPYTDKSILTYQRVPLNEHDLLRLRPMTYLNDSIIMFYLKHLKTQLDHGNSERNKLSAANRGWDDLDGEGIHIFPSFCYTRIKNIMGPGSRNSKAIRTKIWNDLKTWTKGVDIFKKKLLVFPVNESLHWTCVFVCHPGRLVRRYAQGLSRRKGNAIGLDPTAVGPGAPQPTAKPCPADPAGGGMKSSNGGTHNQSQMAISSAAPQPTTTPDPAVPGAVAMKSFDGGTHLSQMATGSAALQPTAKPDPAVPGAAGMKSSNGGTDQSQTATGSTAAQSTTKPGPAIPGAVSIQLFNECAENESQMATGSSVIQPTTKPNPAAPGAVAVQSSNGVTDNQSHTTIGSAAPQSTTKPDTTVLDVVVTKSSDGGAADQSHMATGSAAPQPTNKPDPVVPGAVAMKSSNGGTDQPQMATGSTAAQSTTKPDPAIPGDAATKPSQGGTENQSHITTGFAAAQPTTTPGPAVSCDVAMKSPSGSVANQSQNNSTATKLQATNNENSAKDNSSQKWQCDHCKEAKFDIYNDAVEHEKLCDKNVDWCVIHFDSGKHFKLHKTTEINGNIRKYLNAYYDAEYASSHPGLTSFTVKNMPGFTATVPQQDNTKDCGVYMLENAERVLRSIPSVDNKFVKTKGVAKNSFFGSNCYDKTVIEKKRDDILQIIQTMRRGENTID